MRKIEILNQYYSGSHILRNFNFEVPMGLVITLLGRNGVGYVPQGREIFSLLTVEENLLTGLTTQPRKSRIPDLVFDLFPVLKSMLNQRGGDLSGGQQ